MGPRGRVAVVEMVIDAAGESGLAELQDRRHRLIATDSPLSVIEAVAA